MALVILTIAVLTLINEVEFQTRYTEYVNVQLEPQTISGGEDIAEVWNKEFWKVYFWAIIFRGRIDSNGPSFGYSVIRVPKTSSHLLVWIYELMGYDAYVMSPPVEWLTAKS
ncbi:MAG TPA: hypothetical protein VI816_04105 [Candidatus Bathyarchaeia archaeon]|nr:hypothetical protein [Candidatus Bathyarchaeia archaeon]